MWVRPPPPAPTKNKAVIANWRNLVRYGPRLSPFIDATASIVTYDGIMLWEKHGSSFEVRTQGELPDGRPALDEIVASGASIHLEQMSHDQWFMGIEAGGKYFHLNFYLMDGRLQVNLSDQDDANYTDWEGDSRERPFPGPAL